MNEVAVLLLRILPWIAAGLLVGRIAKGRLARAADGLLAFSIYGLLPVFVLLETWRDTPPLAQAGPVAVVSAALTGYGALAAAVFARLRRRKFQEIVLPVAFMNSAYLAIPVNAAFFGPEAIPVSVLYNIVQGLLHFTLGIWWVSGRMREMFRLPLVYAALVGLGLHAAGVAVPAWAAGSVDFLRTVALPAMLVLVGYELSGAGWFAAGGISGVLLGVGLRMGGGLAAGWLLAEALGLSGTARAVAVFTSGMPSAVNTYIFSRKYGMDAAFAAGMVVAGLLASVAWLPLVASLLR